MRRIIVTKACALAVGIRRWNGRGGGNLRCQLRELMARLRPTSTSGLSLASEVGTPAGGFCHSGWPPKLQPLDMEPILWTTLVPVVVDSSTARAWRMSPELPDHARCEFAPVRIPLASPHDASSEDVP